MSASTGSRVLESFAGPGARCSRSSLGCGLAIRLSAAICLLAGAAAASVADAALTPLAQRREVHIRMTGPDDSDAWDAAAVEFGPFDAGRGLYLGPAYVVASQHTTIGGASIGGSCGASANMLWGPAFEWTGVGVSDCDVVFDLSDRTPFVLQGAVIASPFAHVSVSLDGAYGVAGTDGLVQEFEFVLSLPAGGHSLWVHADATTAGGPFFVEAGVMFDLSIIPEGDLDGDGAVGLADLSAQLTNFGANGGVVYADGDIDADGDVDLADLSALLRNFGIAWQ